MVNPGLKNERPDAVDYDDRVVVLSSDRQHERVTAMPCGEVLAVTLVPVDGDVVFSAVRLQEDQCRALLPRDISSEGEVEVVEHP